jgi:SAM-dependent methyltransferase
MAHPEQKDFCLKVKSFYPSYFDNKNVLDVGSLDINGCNRYLFSNCSYCGIDVGAGKNVDIVSTAHEFNALDATYDIIISTECFEHDMYYDLSIKNIIRMLKSGGLFIFTCATTGRGEHGTNRTTPADAPLLTGNWSDYYLNLTDTDIRKVIDIDVVFKEYAFETNDVSHDLYFYGIKA